MRKPSKYTDIPNVLIDRCDLPDTDIMTFMRLIAAHEEKPRRVSINALARYLNIDKVTFLKRLSSLNNAGLLSIEGSNIRLNLDELWALNKMYDAYDYGVPRWTNLQKAITTFKEMYDEITELVSFNKTREDI